MSWFKRKKKQPEFDIRVIEMSVAGLARQILHDGLLGDPNEVSKFLELPPLSEEVFEMEEEASQARIEAIADFLPLLQTHSEIMANICLASYKAESDEPAPGEHGIDSMLDLFRIISFSSSLTSLAMLVDLGLLYTEEVITHEH